MKDLKQYVLSTNIMLREVVDSMSPIILLRNAHPAYRPDFARQLVSDGIITKEDAEEFVKIIKK